ncbi:MAG TPA: hypothetical protein VFZ53_17245 [Polyangiaceae bacterium]
MTFWRRSAGTLVLLYSSWASAAGAEQETKEPRQNETTEARDAAREEFRRASRLAQSGDWASALTSYSVAHARYPHATTLYNIGYCHEKLGNFAAALRDTLASLRFETRFADRGLAADLRERALLASRELLAKVAVVEVSPNAPDLELRIDGRPLEALSVENRLLAFAAADGAAPSFSPVRQPIQIVANAGAHRIEWRTEGGGNTREISLTAGSTERLELPDTPRVPQKSPARTAPLPVAVPAKPSSVAERDQGSSSWARTVGVGSLALAGGAALVGVGASLVAIDTQRALDEHCTRDGECPASQADRIERFESSTTVANVGFVSAAVLAGAGVTLLFFGPASPTAARLEYEHGPRLKLVRRF